ncbi:olfactory receptor 5AP2-like [Muntiacus reevesi]|uniref:olfactory receptor 5AP2-like n=1 Tax=Muntiacus reevesi TaxID=9886 RepID=UPI003307095D
MSNHSTVTEFILLGFSDHPELQSLLFMMFLFICTITVLGNLGIILLIKIDPHLHTPMYFFLTNLSLVGFSYSSVTAPKMLVDFWAEKPVISFNECATQLFFSGSFAGIEGFLLTVMACDRPVAICQPLLYTVTMPPSLAPCWCWPRTSNLSFTRSPCPPTYRPAGVATYLKPLLSRSPCPPLSALLVSPPPCWCRHVPRSFTDAATHAASASSWLSPLSHHRFSRTELPADYPRFLSLHPHRHLRPRAAEGRRRAFSTCASPRRRPPFPWHSPVMDLRPAAAAQRARTKCCLCLTRRSSPG